MMRRHAALLAAVMLTLAACGSDTSGGGTHTDLRADTGADTADAADAGDLGLGDASSDAARDTADAASELPPRPWPVDQPGPYHVGYTEREVTYDAKGTDQPRTLRLAVWYPTRDTDGTPARYYRLFRRDNVFADASVGVDKPAPLMVFSHGNSSLAEQSYFMTEFFTSHGWIVAAPDHTGNTVRDTQGAIDLTSAVFRPQDISAVIDYMLDLPADDPLAGLADPDKIVMSGHSFGAFTTLANAGAQFAVDDLVSECQQDPNATQFCGILDGREDWQQLFRDGFYDPRIKVAIPQAPGGYQVFRDGMAAMQTPTLMFTGGMDHTLPNDEEGDPIWQHMQGSQHLRINILKAGHFTFSNMCDLVGGFQQLDNDGCGDGFIDPERAYKIINTYSLAFVRYHLFGDQSVADLLSGERAPYADDIELMHKPAP